MKSKKVLIGMLAAAAAGAILGILLAPDKGAKTRRKILNKGEEYADVLREEYEELVNKLSKKYDISRQDAEELVAKGKTRYREVKKEFKNSTT